VNGDDTLQRQTAVDDAPEPLPFCAPSRALTVDAPLRWVRLGWRDYRRAPAQSLGYGLAVVVLSWFVTGIGLAYGSYWAALILLSGFVFVAPVLALGMYSISRQLEHGLEPTFARSIEEQRHSFGTVMVFALALLVVFLIWARAGSMLHVFFPAHGKHDVTQLVTFLAIGSVVGSLFALLTFMFSAFSLPMICDRDVDAVTAIVTSVNAVLRNRGPMAVWVALIVALTAAGFATALLGLAVAIPVLGYATWHAYHDTIDATLWPSQPAGGTG